MYHNFKWQIFGCKCKSKGFNLSCQFLSSKMKITTATIGYPHIGKNREIKKALEAFWNQKITAEILIKTSQEVEESNWKIQLEAGIEKIGIGDQTLYDRVLDWSVRLGLIPKRFQQLEGLARYFAMARGKEGIPALAMTKWFDTNYHYLVPEITSDFLPANFSDFLDTIRRAQNLLGEKTTPIILGLSTLLYLSRLEIDLDRAIEKLLPLYINLLIEIKNMGIKEVQIHDPVLVLSDAVTLKKQFQTIYDRLGVIGVPINLVTYFDDLEENYPWVIKLPVSAISLDFTCGNNLDLIKTHGWNRSQRLGVGIIDGRSIWQIRTEKVLPLLSEIQTLAPNISIQPSASLQFVPHDATRETQLPDTLRNVLSFAEQKLQEIRFLARTTTGENTKIEQELNEELIDANWEFFHQYSPVDSTVRDKIKNLQSEDFHRSLSYQQRLQKQNLLPILPTTTIGSFPQTSEVRQLRVRYKKGEITLAHYQTAIDVQIAECIKIQEKIGLDVLVHGEFERTDMVEYFGQQLTGFAFTEHGWVQSYGSRYVRPPIIHGDVVRGEAMTVREFKVAQSLTQRPVKGMLTGPVTMINWSYVRDDISRQEQAFQIALALQQEVADLEAAGAEMIQIDEPALREGLPLKYNRWGEYLAWAVDAFRLASAIAKPQTQIHTHMCYSEFGDIIAHIQRLDADVLSIENSRSNNKTLREIADGGYSHQVGNGVYDIHSPVVPTTKEILQQLRQGIANLPTRQIWVNPDCGLKNRRWQEVIPALRNMVAATKILRAELEEIQKKPENLLQTTEKH
jgi:5-methyltetrahydropteroyltriglutamate--homocysteine methyltransferase